MAKLAALEYVQIHSSAQILCEEQGIHFDWFLQPLVFWGGKSLTKNELAWRDSGFSSGDPKTFYTFKKER